MAERIRDMIEKYAIQQGMEDEFEQELKVIQHETIVMLPYLLNRVDAVDGHYCIARNRHDGYTEFWNDKLKKWCSSASVLELGKATSNNNNMTAKDILRKTNRDNNYGGVISGGSILEKSIIEAMNAYTLSIVEKVVGELREQYFIPIERRRGADEILTRIKNEIGE